MKELYDRINRYFAGEDINLVLTGEISRIKNKVIEDIINGDDRIHVITSDRDILIMAEASWDRDLSSAVFGTDGGVQQQDDKWRLDTLDSGAGFHYCELKPIQ